MCLQLRVIGFKKKPGVKLHVAGREDKRVTLLRKLQVRYLMWNKNQEPRKSD